MLPSAALAVVVARLIVCGGIKLTVTVTAPGSGGTLVGVAAAGGTVGGTDVGGTLVGGTLVGPTVGGTDVGDAGGGGGGGETTPVGVAVGLTGVAVAVAGVDVGVTVGVTGVAVGVAVPPTGVGGGGGGGGGSATPVGVAVGTALEIVTLPLTAVRAVISFRLLSVNSVIDNCNAVLLPPLPTALTFSFATTTDPDVGPWLTTLVRETVPALLFTLKVGAPSKGASPPETPVTGSMLMTAVLNDISTLYPDKPDVGMFETVTGTCPLADGASVICPTVTVVCCEGGVGVGVGATLTTCGPPVPQAPYPALVAVITTV